MAATKISSQVAAFIEPMECLPLDRVPEGPLWTYEMKLDGFRIEAVKSSGDVTLYSRRGNRLNDRFPQIVCALQDMPDGTVFDGELVALGSDGRPRFQLLQNCQSATSHVMYYAFDVLCCKGRDLTRQPLAERRELLQSILPKSAHVDLSVFTTRSADQMIVPCSRIGHEGTHCQAR